MILFLFIGIALTAVLWSLAPLLRGESGTPLQTSNPDEQIEESLRRQQRMVDLEADRELGKVDEAEFQEMKEGLIREEQSR